jgi:hypothetical protein
VVNGACDESPPSHAPLYYLIPFGGVEYRVNMNNRRGDPRRRGHSSRLAPPPFRSRLR